MTTQTHTHDEAEYTCKHCGETTDELAAEECEESSMGFHAWNHTNPEDSAGTDATIHNSNDDDDDDWKTMSSAECKRQAGLTQVGGVVYEQTDEDDTDGSENNDDHWDANGDSCPACGASEEKQTVTARPAQNTDVEMSLPDRVLECSACEAEWEQ